MGRGCCLAVFPWCRGDGMGSWRKSYAAYKRLVNYRDGAYASGFAKDNLRNLLSAAVVVGGALLLDALVYALTDTVNYVHMVPIVVLILVMGLSSAVIVRFLDRPFSTQALIWIRNIVILGLLAGVDFLMYGELRIAGSLYVYTLILLVLVAVPNFRIHETFLILLWLNASILAFVQLGLVSFPEGQVFINPYRYMVFCSVISLAIAMRRHIDYLLLVRQRTILKTASETDPLTQLLNRRGMEEYLKKRDYRWNVCLALFDIDDFKSYNDTYGHAAGDACLCAAAECFREAAEGCDAVAVRYGGEEFILLCFMANREEALRFTNACLEAMRRRQLRAGYLAHHRYVTLSAGLAVSGQPLRQDVEQCYALVAQADRNLYTAKACGKNQCIG